MFGSPLLVVAFESGFSKCLGTYKLILELVVDVSKRDTYEGF